ncbi:MAG: hypothetical protein V4591_05765, partial [Bdellovibrionota bacterium]
MPGGVSGGGHCKPIVGFGKAIRQHVRSAAPKTSSWFWAGAAVTPDSQQDKSLITKPTNDAKESALSKEEFKKLVRNLGVTDADSKSLKDLKNKANEVLTKFIKSVNVSAEKSENIRNLILLHNLILRVNKAERTRNWQTEQGFLLHELEKSLGIICGNGNEQKAVQLKAAILFICVHKSTSLDSVSSLTKNAKEIFRVLKNKLDSCRGYRQQVLDNFSKEYLNLKIDQAGKDDKNEKYLKHIQVQLCSGYKKVMKSEDNFADLTVLFYNKKPLNESALLAIIGFIYKNSLAKSVEIKKISNEEFQILLNIFFGKIDKEILDKVVKEHKKIHIINNELNFTITSKRGYKINIQLNDSSFIKNSSENEDFLLKNVNQTFFFSQKIKKVSVFCQEFKIKFKDSLLGRITGTGSKKINKFTLTKGEMDRLKIKLKLDANADLTDDKVIESAYESLREELPKGYDIKRVFLVLVLASRMKKGTTIYNKAGVGMKFLADSNPSETVKIHPNILEAMKEIKWFEDEGFDPNRPINFYQTTLEGKNSSSAFYGFGIIFTGDHAGLSSAEAQAKARCKTVVNTLVMKELREKLDTKICDNIENKLTSDELTKEELLNILGCTPMPVIEMSELRILNQWKEVEFEAYKQHQGFMVEALRHLSSIGFKISYSLKFVQAHNKLESMSSITSGSVTVANVVTEELQPKPHQQLTIEESLSTNKPATMQNELSRQEFPEGNHNALVSLQENYKKLFADLPKEKQNKYQPVFDKWKELYSVVNY